VTASHREPVTAPAGGGAPPSVAELVEDATARLAAAGVDSPDVDARVLAEDLLGADPRHAPAAIPGPAARDAFERALVRREAREPLQLVLGRVAFHDIELECRPGVFIARPETEVLVELALAAAARATARRGAEGDGTAAGPLVVLEPCTGSGAVALAMAAARTGLEVAAADRSPLAVAAARANRDRLARSARLRSPVEVLQGDLLDAFDPVLRGRVDVLVANPPYLPERDLGTLAPEVADHDPVESLVAGPDGHELVEALLALAPVWLAPGGAVLLELDERRADEAAEHARTVGLTAVAVHADLTGRARFVSARRPSVAATDADRSPDVPATPDGRRRS
jgi:release factor glutamine methyltransferase